MLMHFDGAVRGWEGTHVKSREKEKKEEAATSKSSFKCVSEVGIFRSDGWGALRGIGPAWGFDGLGGLLGFLVGIQVLAVSYFVWLRSESL